MLRSPPRAPAPQVTAHLVQAHEDDDKRVLLECLRSRRRARAPHMCVPAAPARTAQRPGCEGSAVEVSEADLVPVIEHGLALLHIEVLGVRLARDVEGEEARGLDAREDELVLLPHAVVGEVHVEVEGWGLG